MLGKSSILGNGTKALAAIGHMVLGKRKGILASTTITFLLVSVAVGAIGATYFYSSSMGNNGEPRVQITNLASDDVLAEGSMELRGTAAHDNGAIQAISVRIDGGPPTSVVPSSINDFSEWSVSLPISSPGNHTIEVEATDENDKIGSTKVSVVVKDAASVITVPPGQTIEATGPLGALTHYPPVAVKEDARIAGDPECSPASGSMFPIGTTTVTCSASYAGGNTVSANFTVSVRDTTAPTIVAPTDVVAKNTGLAFMKISLGELVVNDAVDENPAVSNNAPANGFALGTTAVVWTASDDYGNKATAIQKVTVTAATSQDSVSSSGEATRTTFVSTGGGGGGGGSKSSSNSNSGDKDDNGVNTGSSNGQDGSGNNKGQNGGGAKDTTAPSVAITNPANGATVSLGTLALTGTASDNSGDSGVNTVQVRIDGGSYIVATPKASGDWSTWSASLSVSSAGSHTITARATDKAGNQRTSSITVTAPTTEVTAPATDDAAPSVAILQPEADSIVTLTEDTIVVTGTASDSGSGVNAVEVRIDDGSYVMATPKAEDDWSSWSATLPITTGEHRIVPRATDIAGNQAWNSIDVTFVEDTAEDTTSPSVAITSPADGSTVTLGSNAITIQGTASDSGSGVSTVEVRIGDGSYSPATPKAPGDWSTWSISLPATDGEHRLVPRATDNAGNQAWNSIYVTVTSPTSGDDGTSSSSTLDDFGIEKIYQTTAGGNEWYVDMDDPTSDPLFRNLPSMTKQSDGSWQVNGGSRGQVRMEAWSPSNEKWLNVEITGYAKMVSGSNELIQWYSRGGHHTSSNECLGSAVKARLYGDGEARWVKEINHPAYTGNRGSVQATNEPLADRWIGFKAVMYNFVENGRTYVRMESYIDDDVTGANGNLVIDNDWQLASVVEDRGGWSTGSSDFNSSCSPLDRDSDEQYRQRDEILNMSGGTATQNIAAWRSDDLTWNWKYLSVREIVPPS